MIRDYTIHLKVNVPDTITAAELDEVVRNVVDASTAREAISDGLYYSNLGEDTDPMTLENFYVVSATRPEGGIG